MTEFQRAVKLVIDTVSFDKNSTVQVFEANIRYECQCGCRVPILHKQYTTTLGYAQRTAELDLLPSHSITS